MIIYKRLRNWLFQRDLLLRRQEIYRICNEYVSCEECPHGREDVDYDRPICTLKEKADRAEQLGPVFYRSRLLRTLTKACREVRATQMRRELSKRCKKIGSCYQCPFHPSGFGLCDMERLLQTYVDGKEVEDVLR